MLRFKTLLLLALTSTAGLAHAQTGPTGPAAPTTPQTGPVAQTNILNPDRLTTYLKGQGHTVEQKRFQNGAVTLLVKMQKDGWRYEAEIEYSIDQKNLTFVFPLGQPSSQFSAAQLQALLKQSYSMNPAHFCYRESDRKICLEDPLYFTTNWTEAGFQQSLDRLLKMVRDTHPLWDASRWPLGAAAPVASPTAAPVAAPAAPAAPTSAPTSPPAAPQVPGVPAVSQGLGNVNFVGSETLGSYGRLELRFSGANQVTMIDKDGQTPGTYTVQGSTVTVTFSYASGGSVVYTGTMNGPTFAGNATNGKDNWTFTVSK